MTPKADVIDDATKQMTLIALFSDVFQGSAYANVHLRPKVWYENDRKNMKNLLKHILEKMLIFNQKILKVAIMSKTQKRAP